MNMTVTTRCCAVLAVLAACSVAAAPAGAASGAALGASVKKAISAKTHVRVTRASCPSVVDAHQGRTTICSLTFASGDRSPVRVRFTSSTGGYTAVLTNFLVRNLEDQLEDKFAEQEISAQVTCPKARKMKKGDRFSCTAHTASDGTQVVRILQTGNGLARIEP